MGPLEFGFGLGGFATGLRVCLASRPRNPTSIPNKAPLAVRLRGGNLRTI
jgi:hypothetical protein